MNKTVFNGSSGRKPQWFARRQIYLRTGQESQYVELSPMLQIGVALGFGVLALWLIGASYGAVSSAFFGDDGAALMERLALTEQALGDAERERDAALEDAAKIPDLEIALADAQAIAVDASQQNDASALRAELEQTKAQLEDAQRRLSETKAEQATLQAKLEAEAVVIANADEKTAEEAASLHAQLEEAFDESAALKEERDQAVARLTALNQEKATKDETIERNTALLKAATAEIERLQASIGRTETESGERAASYQETIDSLEQQLDQTAAARDELEREAADLRTRLDQTAAAVTDADSQAPSQAAAPNADADAAAADATADAEFHARSIEADLREAELLAVIEGLRAEQAAGDDAGEGRGEEARDRGIIASLRQRLALAESELERLLLSGLKGKDEARQSPAASEDLADAEGLRSELMTARADIIKLNADVKAAKRRLAEQAEAQNGRASIPANSAKLEQQLASTRSRVQQLNKALADAKLREVAIDLALINVVPSPSPPAPR